VTPRSDENRYRSARDVLNCEHGSRRGSHLNRITLSIRLAVSGAVNMKLQVRVLVSCSTIELRMLSPPSGLEPPTSRDNELTSAHGVLNPNVGPTEGVLGSGWGAKVTVCLRLGKAGDGGIEPSVTIISRLVSEHGIDNRLHTNVRSPSWTESTDSVLDCKTRHAV